MQEKDNAVADFKTVVQRYPDAAEAGLARGELTSLGIDPNKGKATGKRPVKP
jgi:hypothetical protein